MDKKEKFLSILIASYLSIFALGVLPGVILASKLNLNFYLHPVDLIVLIIMIVGIYRRWMLPKPFINFFWFLLYSMIFAVTFFPISELKIGILYAIRLISYAYFLHAVTLLSRSEKEVIKLVLPVIGIFVAIFGWIQYFLLPDLTSLKYIGWDDHLFRLTSTFLDPAFTGIIIVLSILSLFSIKLRNNLKITSILFLLISLGFTYSRSSYIALTGALLVFVYLKKISLKALIAGLSLFGIIVFLLPRPAGYGVRLERVHSIVLKGQNIKESLILYKESPVFGIGFSNICAGKHKYLSNYHIGDHSCSGLDNSFLVVLVTTGIVGLFNFLYLLKYLILLSKDNLIITIFVAVIIHSIFTNTLFYPWVMGWMALTVGSTSLKEYK